MDININLTIEELNEMGFDEGELKLHVIGALDSCDKELVGFHVNIEVE